MEDDSASVSEGALSGGITENHEVEGFYRELVTLPSDLRTSSYEQEHWTFPSPNFNTDVSVPRIPSGSQFQYKVSRPRPFLPPSSVSPTDLKVGNPIESVLDNKIKWEKKLQSLIHIARKAKKWNDGQAFGLNVGKVKSKNADKPIYSVNKYVDVAKHLANEPHPSFSGTYNWLLTGGSTKVCDISGEKYLLSASGKDADLLCATLIDQQEKQFNFLNNQKSTRYPLPHHYPLFQIVANSYENKGIIGARQEKICSLFKLKKGQARSMTVQTLIEIHEEDGIFTSIDIDPFESDKFCTLDSGPFLKLWDLNTSSCVNSTEIVAPSKITINSSWGFLQYSNSPNEIFVLNRRSVFVKDQRMPLSQNVKEYCPSLITSNCDELGLLLKTPSLPVVYVATTHHMLGLDLRVGWTQRWTHLLKSPPMFGTVFSDAVRGNEVVLLSSSIPDDTVAIVNSWEDERVESDTFPICLPSTGDCLLLARSRGTLLGKSLKERLDKSTTGLTHFALKNDVGFTSLRSTSAGDVFGQQFSPKSGVNDFSSFSIKEEIQADIEVWDKWEEAHDKAWLDNKPELACPTVSNSDIFNFVRIPWRQKQYTVWKANHWRKTFRPIFMGIPEEDERTYSDVLLELSSCNDVLAGVLLRAWDDQGLVTKLDSQDYVNTWLGNMTPSQDGSELNASNLGTPERAPSLSSCIEFGTPSCASDSGRFNGDDSVFKIPTTPGARPKKKSRRESSGF
ncbi:hypothetical protein ONE63_002656 [Megalurothrips usitatus]|uniref:Uncharacterized protein n=1 Tax=Megalurothrips usitatus TaxID=439358 RepID=A0AAV7XFM0_9NEOP|nr:hypothetical protein ONE63_002656 [Megalurothrips usitatus]KAJ1522366.1 hypothetical protein ONE63_002656 [Megalurothrips usitatus]